MAEDKNCPLNLEGICFEMVAHGFHEKQLREQGRMELCEMGRSMHGSEAVSYHRCVIYGSFQNALKTPGIISPKCYQAITDAKYHDQVDGRIVDLKSKELITATKPELK